MSLKIKPNNPKKILIANPFGIGDVIFTLTVVRSLKKRFPLAVIGFVGNERTEPLLALSPDVAARHILNRDEWRKAQAKGFFYFFKKFFDFWSSIRSQRYDWLIDYSLGREFSFFSFLIGIPVRIGLDYKSRGIFLTHKAGVRAYEKESVAQTQMGLLRGFGIFSEDVEPGGFGLKLSASAENYADHFLLQNGFDPEKPVLGVVPGGGRSWGEKADYKQWPPQKFSQLIRRVVDDFSVQVILFGDAAEQPLLDQVLRDFPEPNRTVVCSGRPLEEVCALLKRCRMVLANDGGLAHLAHAMGTATVVLFGPVDEKAYAPFGGSAAREALSASVDCRPCYKNFIFTGCAHNRQCLERISVEEVYRAVKKNLASNPALPL